MIEKVLKKEASKDIYIIDDSCSIASTPLMIHNSDPLKAIAVIEIFILNY